MSARKRHPSKDPRTIARDVAELIGAQVPQLADIDCPADDENAAQAQASFWADDLLNLLRGADTEDKAVKLCLDLRADLPAALQERLNAVVEALKADDIPQREAGYLLGLEVGARYAAAILARTHGRVGQK